MAKYLSVSYQKAYISKGIIPGVIIGGFLGILMGFLLRSNSLIIPVLLGIIIGGLIGGNLALRSTGNINAKYPKTDSPKQSISDSENVVLQIKEEQLSLAKKWIQTGEVRIFRESFAEEKTFIVPVKREELVIVKKDLSPSTLEHKDVHKETIRILLSEEQVEFTKHWVALEDISIYKQQLEDIKQIEKTLRREEPKVKTSGSPKVSDELTNS